jgi:hypothetical protein
MRKRTYQRILGMLAYHEAIRKQGAGYVRKYRPDQHRAHAFREELRKRGWASGVNVQFDKRWTVDNMEQIRSAAENLVELNPNAILAVGGRVIPILINLTHFDSDRHSRRY